MWYALASCSPWTTASIGTLLSPWTYVFSSSQLLFSISCSCQIVTMLTLVLCIQLCLLFAVECWIYIFFPFLTPNGNWRILCLCVYILSCVILKSLSFKPSFSDVFLKVKIDGVICLVIYIYKPTEYKVVEVILFKFLVDIIKFWKKIISSIYRICINYRINI